jgi:hypothetical protein
MPHPPHDTRNSPRHFKPTPHKQSQGRLTISPTGFVWRKASGGNAVEIKKEGASTSFLAPFPRAVGGRRAEPVGMDASPPTPPQTQTHTQP